MSVTAREVYLVTNGDTLSTILQSLGIKNIYGKHGAIQKTLELNPSLKKDNGNKIFPNMKIVIESSKELIVNHQDKKIESVSSEDKEVISQPNNPVVDSSLQEKCCTSKNENEQFTYFKVSPEVSWLKFTTEDTDRYSKISALTKANFGIHGNLGLNISTSNKIYGFGFISQVNFYQADHYLLNETKFLRQAYGVGWEYLYDSSTSYALSAGYYNEFFISNPSTSTINIKSIQIPELQFAYRRKLSNYKKFILESGILGKIIPPYNLGDVDVKFGYALGAELTGDLGGRGLGVFYNFSKVQAVGKSTSAFELGWKIVLNGKNYE